MSKLDELICEFCSNGVETVKIKNAFQRLKGTPITAARMKEINNLEGEIKVFAGGKTVITAKEKDIPNANIIRVPAVLVQSRGVIDVIYYDKPFTFKNEMWAYTTSDSTTVKYLFYVLKNNVQRFRDAASGMGSLPQISLPVTEEFEIPLPPIEVQREIVRILDNFTELAAELTAELTARKTQYTYYRDELLANNYNSKIKRLEECCDSIADGDHQAPPKADSGIPFITISDIDERHEIDFNVIKYVPDEYYNRLADKRRPQKGDVLYTVVGSYGIPVYVKENKKFVFQRHIAILRPNNAVVDSRYLYHAMNGTAFHRQANLAAKGAAQKTIGLASLAKMTVPVPPLDVQNRIVNVLDNFEKICADLNIGLPAEIEARQKQYEYYRDKLLTFVETGNTILSRAEQSRAEQSRAEQSRAEQSRALIKLVQYVYGCVWLELGDVIVSLNTGLNPRKFFKLNTEDATNYYITIREMKDGKIVPSEKTDRMNDEARKLCNNRSNLEVGDVLFSGTGTIGETAVIEKEPSNWNIKEGVYAIKPNQTMIQPMYLRYILMTDFIKKEYMKKAAGGTVQSVPMGELKKIRIPVPSLQEQNRIVGVLKQLDDLCNDLTSGLPAEIEARQKQYEYYRDKLLTFKEVAAT